jgi:AcrR family transcriptional regulator
MKKVQYRHGNLREALINDAVEELRNTPAELLSIRDLAERAGVSPRAPYVHFATKTDLLRAVAYRGFEILLSKFKIQNSTLVDLGEAYIGLAVSHPNLFRLMFSGIAGTGEECLAPGESFRVLVDMIASIEPDWSETEQIEGAVALWAFVHGLADLRIDQQMSSDFWSKTNFVSIASKLGHLLSRVQPLSGSDL